MKILKWVIPPILAIICYFASYNIAKTIYDSYTYKNIKVDNLHELLEYIHTNYDYISDGDDIDHWQYPKETIKRKAGDCEDLSILFQDIAYKKFDIDCLLLWIGYEDYDNNNDLQTIGHITVFHDRIIYDPTWNLSIYSGSLTTSIETVLYDIINRDQLYNMIENHRQGQ